MKYFESREKIYPFLHFLESKLKPYAFKEWLFDVDTEPHRVSITIGVFQTRTIVYDGTVIVREFVGHNGGSEYAFSEDGIEFKMVYEVPFWSLRRLLPIQERLHLFVNGQELL